MMIPFYRLPGIVNGAMEYLVRNLTGYTTRADNEPFMVSLQFLAVCARTIIKALLPGIRN
jgi:hypothetical protein